MIITSPIYIREIKKKEKYRVISKLKEHNKFASYKHFKINTF